MSNTLNVNLTHTLFYSSLAPTSADRFAARVKAGFPGAVLYKPDGSCEGEAHFRDLQIVQDFLRGGSQTYDVCRFSLADLCPVPEENGMKAACLMVSFFEETGVTALSFHYSLEDAAFDTVIGLRQSGASRVYRFGTETIGFLTFGERVAKSLGLPAAFTEQSFLCEVTRFFDYQSPDQIEAEAPECLYGLLSGDEGYAFVPQELCRERLSCAWGSRNFIRIYGVGKAFLFLNLIGSEAHRAYLERQTQFGNEIYGGANAYFFLGSNPLSVNHGILFSVEFVMMLKALISDVLTFQSAFGKRKKHLSYYRRIRETRDFRRKIILVLEKVEQTAITEIGELSSVLMESQHIAPIVDQVKYLLELLEGDLSLVYSERNNTLVTVLTVLGLLLAAWQVYLAL